MLIFLFWGEPLL